MLGFALAGTFSLLKTQNASLSRSHAQFLVLKVKPGVRPI